MSKKYGVSWRITVIILSLVSDLLLNGCTKTNHLCIKTASNMFRKL